MQGEAKQGAMRGERVLVPSWARGPPAKRESKSKTPQTLVTAFQLRRAEAGKTKSHATGAAKFQDTQMRKHGRGSPEERLVRR